MSLIKSTLNSVLSVTLLLAPLLFTSCGGNTSGDDNSVTKKVYYIDGKYSRVKGGENAIFIREAYYKNDKIIGDSITRYYYIVPNSFGIKGAKGPLAFEGHVVSENPDVIVGHANWYYATGQKQWDINYDSLGLKQGIAINYEPDGREKNYNYLNDTLVTSPEHRIESDEINPKFLITGNSAGYFTLHDTIGNLPEWYGWNDSYSVEDYDGCTTPTRIIGKITISLQDAHYNNASDTLKLQDTTKYIYTESDNCTGYYSKDSIESITIEDMDFMTEERIGVGSTFKEMQDAYPKLYSNFGINVDEEDEIFIKVEKHPKIIFCFTREALTFTLEDYSDDAYKLKLEDGSHFKPYAPISKIKIYDPYTHEE